MDVDADSSGWSSGDEARVRKRRPADKADGRHTNNRWTKEEHARLLELVAVYGDSGNWAAIAARMPGRTSKQVRQRYINFTRPGTRRADWTADEEDCIALMHATHGPAWSVICKSLDNRTENAVKNHWHATLRSKNLDSRQGSLLAIYIRLIRDGALPCLATYEEAKGRLAQQKWAPGTAAASPMLTSQTMFQQQPQQLQSSPAASNGNSRLALHSPTLKQASGSLAKSNSRQQLMKRAAPPRQDSTLSGVENGRMFQGLTLDAANDQMVTMCMPAGTMPMSDAAECCADSSHASMAAIQPFSVTTANQQQQQGVVDGSGDHVPSGSMPYMQLQSMQMAMAQQAMPSNLQPGSAMSCGVIQQWQGMDLPSSMPNSQQDLGSSTALVQNAAFPQQQLPQQQLYTLQPRNSNEQIEALMCSLEQPGTHSPMPSAVQRLAALGQPARAQSSQLALLVSGMHAAATDFGTGSAGMDLMQEVVRARARAAAQLSARNMPIKMEVSAPEGQAGPMQMMSAAEQPAPQSLPVLSASAAYKALTSSGCRSMGSVPVAGVLPSEGLNVSKPMMQTSTPECRPTAASHHNSPAPGAALLSYMAPQGSNVSSPHSTASDFITVPRSLLVRLGQQQASQQLMNLQQQQLMGQSDMGGSPAVQQLMGAWSQQQQMVMDPQQQQQQPSARLAEWLHKQNVMAARSPAVANHVNILQNQAPANLLSMNTSGLSDASFQTTTNNGNHGIPLLKVNTRRPQQQWGAGLMDVEQCSTPDLHSLLDSSCF